MHLVTCSELLAYRILQRGVAFALPSCGKTSGPQPMEKIMTINTAEWLFLAAFFAPPLVLIVSFITCLVSGRVSGHPQILPAPAK
jgi:hypothetical protein